MNRVRFLFDKDPANFPFSAQMREYGTTVRTFRAAPSSTNDPPAGAQILPAVQVAVAKDPHPEKTPGPPRSLRDLSGPPVYRPSTDTGIALVNVVVLLPICPLLPYPQHFALIDESMEQLWASPAPMAMIPLFSSHTCTGVDDWAVVLVAERTLSPNLPRYARPQHMALPVSVTAQVCVVPAEIATTPARPATV